MSNIITPENQGNTQPELDETQPAAELTQREVERIAGALAQLHELEDQKIVTPTSEAQKKGLREYLSNSFIKFGPQFLGAWFTAHGEYGPLVDALSLIFRRVTANVDRMRMQEAAHRAAQVKAQAEAGTLPKPSPEAAKLKESQQ